MATAYTHQGSNITRTWLLFGAFLVLIIGMGWIFSYVFDNEGILFMFVIFSIVSSLVGYFASDKIALSIAKARQIERKDNPVLWNIVENLSITAGLPMPRIYISPETQINAFATGRNPKNAAIAVTAGALERLERPELEGVIAHELSHIGNRDILVSTVAVIFAGILALLGDFFLRSMMFGGGRRDSNDRAGGVFLLVGLALSILAPIGAMLMQMAISRKRESLADASGILLTRYPDGLISALTKIGADAQPMRTATDSTAHLWLDNPFKGRKISGFHKLFLTHPPIEERVAALRDMQL